MIRDEIKLSDAPSLSFLYGTRYMMYIGPDLSPDQRSQLRSNDNIVQVLYLPEIIGQLTVPVMKYNFPGLEFPRDFSVENIYSNIKKEIGYPQSSVNRLLVRWENGRLIVYDAQDRFGRIISYLSHFGPEPQVFIDEEIEKIESIKHKRKSKNGPFKIIWTKIVDSSEELYNEQNTGCRTPHKAETNVSDKTFDEEMSKAMNEAQDMIQSLIIKGCPPELILKWIDQSIKLSRLRITKQYKILLVDYDLEIKMGPLPKTVFLFYLRHPEGVRFSYLQDHVDEIRNIYEHVSVNDDPEKMAESIASLIDPLNNSICEKCAAIKKAFLLKVNDNVARNYYVTGIQGGEKGIALDRNLVEWECEL